MICYSQRDPKLKNKKLGFSNSSFWNYGCAVTALANLLCRLGYQITPGELNDKLKKVKGFVDDLVIWQAIEDIFPNVKFEDWIDCPLEPAPMDKIDEYLSKGIPVIIWIDFHPDEPIQQHFVLITQKDDQGHYIYCDPWTGEEYYFIGKLDMKASRATLGVRFYSHKEIETIKKILIDAGYTDESKHIEVVKTLIKDYKEYLKLIEKVLKLEEKLKKLEDDFTDYKESNEKEMTELNTKLGKQKGQIKDLQKELKIKRKRVQELEAEFKTLRKIKEVIQKLINKIRGK